MRDAEENACPPEAREGREPARETQGDPEGYPPEVLIAVLES